MTFCLVSQIVLEDLSRAREGFVFASNLHLVYLVIPISDGKDPDSIHICTIDMHVYICTYQFSQPKKITCKRFYLLFLL
jgi:hypothetical protein